MDRPIIHRILKLALFALVVLLVLLPVVFLLLASIGLGPLGPKTNITLGNYLAVLEDPFFASSLVNSITFAALSSLVATGLGFVLAFINRATDAPLASVLRSVMVAMLAMPSFLESIGWTFLLSPRAGLVNVIYSRLVGAQEPLFNIYSFAGLVFAMGLNLTPVSFFLISPAFSLIDKTLIEMSTVFGGGLWRTIYRVYLPIVLPSIVSAYIYTFIIGLEAFDTPAIIGIPAGIYVLTTSIYKKMVSDIPPDYGGATAYAVFLAALASVALWSYRFVVAHAEKYGSLTGRAEVSPTLRLGRKLKFTITLIIMTYLVIHPISVVGVLILASLHSFWNPSVLFQNITLENFLLFLTYPLSWVAAINSALVALITCIVTVIGGLMVSYFCYRRPFKGSHTFALITSLPLAVPPMVLAIGVYWTALFSNVGIYGTVWALVYAYSLRYLPLVVRLVVGPLLQIGREIEDAARIYGGIWRSLTRVILPLMRGPLIYAATYVTVIVLTNLSVAVLLVTKESVVLSTTLYSLWNTGERLEATAGGLLYFSVTLSVALIGNSLLTKSDRQ
ncbi:MAG: iron ABC transporter permease [Aigarchaeota archaeon]|nr:iron ABC transporter permease [Candidatus Calditenuis fumarioli]